MIRYNLALLGLLLGIQLSLAQESRPADDTPKPVMTRPIDKSDSELAAVRREIPIPAADYPAGVFQRPEHLYRYDFEIHTPGQAARVLWSYTNEDYGEASKVILGFSLLNMALQDDVFVVVFKVGYGTYAVPVRVSENGASKPMIDLKKMVIAVDHHVDADNARLHLYFGPKINGSLKNGDLVIELKDLEHESFPLRFSLKSDGDKTNPDKFSWQQLPERKSGTGTQSTLPAHQNNHQRDGGVGWPGE